MKTKRGVTHGILRQNKNNKISKIYQFIRKILLKVIYCSTNIELALSILCTFYVKNLTSSCRITALYHELRNNSMEYRSVVVASSRKLGKIVACLGCVIPIQFDSNCSHAEKQNLSNSLFSNQKWKMVKKHSEV